MFRRFINIIKNEFQIFYNVVSKTHVFISVEKQILEYMPVFIDYTKLIFFILLGAINLMFIEFCAITIELIIELIALLIYELKNIYFFILYIKLNIEYFVVVINLRAVSICRIISRKIANDLFYKSFISFSFKWIIDPSRRRKAKRRKKWAARYEFVCDLIEEAPEELVPFLGEVAHEFYLDVLYAYIKRKPKEIYYLVLYSILKKESDINSYFDSKYNDCNETFVIKQKKSVQSESFFNILSSRQKTKYYLANNSFWPLFLSLFLGLFVLLFVILMHNLNFISVLGLNLVSVIISTATCIFFWINIFYLEKKLGYHTYEVRRNIKLGFYIFLFTEALCFAALFWTFLHALLAASIHIGQFNPGEGTVNFWMSECFYFHPSWDLNVFSEDKKASMRKGTSLRMFSDISMYNIALAIGININLFDSGQLVNPYKKPLTNTLILLASAFLLNASHVKLKQGKYSFSFLWLTLTIILGFWFIINQYLEIKNCCLLYNDGIFASCFYSLTGLHGIHVIIGVFSLIMCLINFLKLNYTQKRHDTYWFAILYWHFVDVVWILVYVIVYLWPSVFFFSEDVKWMVLGDRKYCFNISKVAFEQGILQKIAFDWELICTAIIHMVLTDLHHMSPVKYKEEYSDNIKKRNFTKSWRKRKLLREAGIKRFIKTDKQFYIQNFDELKKSFLIQYLNNLSWTMNINSRSIEVYESLQYFDYNEIKRQGKEYGTSLFFLHHIVFAELQTSFGNDIRNKKYKFTLFIISYMINKRFTRWWSYYYMPYMFEIEILRDYYFEQNNDIKDNIKE